VLKIGGRRRLATCRTSKHCSPTYFTEWGHGVKGTPVLVGSGTTCKAIFKDAKSKLSSKELRLEDGAPVIGADPS
jgi:hypothetical protein